MRFLSIAAAVVMFVTSGVATPDDRDRFVGTWSLEVVEERDADGNWKQVADRVGKDPMGYIMYDSAGNMAVQVMGSDRPRLLSDDLEKATAEQLKVAFLGYAAYFGTYEVNEKEGSVTHHREGSLVPNQTGTDAKRLYIFKGDTLTLMPSQDRRLRWKRVK